MKLEDFLALIVFGMEVLLFAAWIVFVLLLCAREASCFA